MPANELIHSQLPPDILNGAVNYLQIVINMLIPSSQNLTPEEKQKFGSIGEQNKLFVGKVQEYQVRQPTLASSDVDWALFNQHWQSRSGFAQLEELCVSIIEMCSDPRILHDYSLYQNALVDYNYSKYKANSSSGGAAYTAKVAAIKQFFPNTGGGGNTGSEPEETEETGGDSPTA